MTDPNESGEHPAPVPEAMRTTHELAAIPPIGAEQQPTAEQFASLDAACLQGEAWYAMGAVHALTTALRCESRAELHALLMRVDARKALVEAEKLRRENEPESHGERRGR